MDNKRVKEITIEFHKSVLNDCTERLKDLHEQKRDIEESMAKLDSRILRTLKFLEKAEK